VTPSVTFITLHDVGGYPEVSVSLYVYISISMIYFVLQGVL